MNRNAQKGLKPFVLKATIVVMVMCYIFGPLHKEINNVLHVVYHQIELPNSTVISDSNSLKFNDDGETHHYMQNKKHHHNFLEFFNKIIEASNSDNNSENSTIVKLKIDKHIRTKKKVKVLEFYSYKSKHISSRMIKCTLNGYSFKVFQPPKHFV